MSHCFRLTIHPLGDSFHGRGDGGEPEWPPSPLRAFQALVAAAAGRWREPQFGSYPRPALEWLEGLGAPEVVAPTGRTATRPYRLYVPNNAGDLMVSAWARGDTEASMAGHRTEKDVRPTRFADGQSIHFDWPLTLEQHRQGTAHFATLQAAARSITHLGWGVDMVAAEAKVIPADTTDALTGHRWRPVAAGGTPLRVPKPGTLADLMRKHEAFLGRLSADGFRPVPPLQSFDVVGYDSPTVGSGPPAAPQPVAAFQILAPDASRVASFDPVRRTHEVAAWVRHAAGEVCADWPFGDVAGFVHGHDPTDNSQPLRGAAADRRFSYLPLPSIETRGERGESVGRIRRVLVAAPPGCQEQIDWVRRRLVGRELMEERHAGPPKPAGLLNLLPTSDWVLRRYLGQSTEWSTVTPVLLPGYDDRDPAKARRLLVTALLQAELPPEVLDPDRLELRSVGFLAGTDLAGRYARPENLRRFPAYHVRATFRHVVAGPLAVGAGRYRGFGLFARTA